MEPVLHKMDKKKSYKQTLEYRDNVYLLLIMWLISF